MKKKSEYLLKKFEVQKKRADFCGPWAKLHLDGLCQLAVDGVAAVLDGDGAVTLATGDDGDGFAAVAAQGEQKGVQLLVIGFNTADDVFFSLYGVVQSHKYHLLFQLAYANSQAVILD